MKRIWQRVEKDDLGRIDWRNSEWSWLEDDAPIAQAKGGGGGGTQVVKNDPPAYLQPYLTEIANEAQTAYSQVSKDPYTGQLLAGQTQTQADALNAGKQVAQNNMGMGDTYRNAANYAVDRLNTGGYNTLNGAYSPTNASTSGAIEAAIDPLRQELLTKTIPGMQSAAISQGAWGGNATDYLQAQALDDFSRNATNTAANIAYQDIARRDELGLTDLIDRRQNENRAGLLEQSLLSQIPQLVTGGYAADLMPIDTLQQLGDREQLQTQDQLNSDYQQYMLSQLAPFQGLSEYANLISGTALGGTSTARGGGGNSSGLAGVLSGALGGAGLASSIGGLGAAGSGLAAVGGPWGMAAGALLGGLGGFF